MKHTDALHLAGSAVCSTASQQLIVSLSEDEILSLQNSFLTIGFHSMHVANHPAGRSLIYAFLQSMPLYNRIACLTLTKAEELPDHIFDIGIALLSTDINEQAIEQFFINEFDFDFVWIEISEVLIQTTWYEHFCTMVEVYGREIPVLKVH